MNRYAGKVQQYLDNPHIPEQIIRTLSESELESLERELGHQLPGDYREFLRDYGGLVTYSGFPFPPGHELVYGGCEVFHGVFPENPNCDLMQYYQQISEYGTFKLLPIGRGDNGYVCLVIDGAEKEAIYFLRTGAGSHGAISEDLYFVIGSFNQFLPMLA